jgi:hypothetical protein
MTNPAYQRYYRAALAAVNGETFASIGAREGCGGQRAMQLVAMGFRHALKAQPEELETFHTIYVIGIREKRKHCEEWTRILQGLIDEG